MNHIFTKRALCAITFCGGALLLTGCPPNESEGPSVPTTTSTDKIVFVRPRAGSLSDPRATGTIWSVGLDGQNARQLTQTVSNLAAGDSQPDLFRNRIAFIRASQLWVMDADGSNPKQVTPSDSGPTSFRAVADPAWKPSGNEITFTAQKRNEGFAHIYSIKLGDNSIVQLTGTSRNPDTSINPPATPGTTNEFEATREISDEFDPEWSPDGTQLVFATDRHYRLTPGSGSAGQKTVTELYKINYAAGSTLTRLTRNLGGAPTSSPAFSGSTGNPVFSNTGTDIVFESSGGRRLYLIPASARALTPDKWKVIFPESANDTNPTYDDVTPFIAFSRNGSIFFAQPNPIRGVSTPKLIINQGVQPSLGNVTVVSATPTPRPTTVPTPRPTARPTTAPPSATPTPRPTTGGTQFANLSPQESLTIKRVSDTQVDTFEGIAITGDHESDGSTLIQGFGTYRLNLPAGANVTSAKLNLYGGSASTIEGNPFSFLGGLYVEGASLPTFSEGALEPGAVLVGRTPQSFFPSTNVTALVRAALQRNPTNPQFIARLRFQTARNNNGKNDNYQVRFGGLEITYTR